jgi:pimeloyl-ACP methyl ester carboxylesterase
VLLNPILRPALDGPNRVATAAARAYYGLVHGLPRSLAHRLLGSRTVAAISGGIMTTTADPALRRWIRAEHRRQAGAFASREVVRESYLASTRTTVVDFAGTFVRPTLVIGADRDPLGPAHALTSERSGIREGEFRVLSGRGHLLPYEAADECAALIEEWRSDH